MILWVFGCCWFTERTREEGFAANNVGGDKQHLRWGWFGSEDRREVRERVSGLWLAAGGVIIRRSRGVWLVYRSSIINQVKKFFFFIWCLIEIIGVFGFSWKIDIMKGIWVWVLKEIHGCFDWVFELWCFDRENEGEAMKVWCPIFLIDLSRTTPCSWLERDTQKKK